MKLLVHGMKVKNSDGRIVTFPEVQFGFTPERGTIDAVFIFRNLQKEYHANGRNYVCLVDLEKAFDRVQRSVGVGNEERNSRSFRWISDESV